MEKRKGGDFMKKRVISLLLAVLLLLPVLAVTASADCGPTGVGGGPWVIRSWQIWRRLWSVSCF
jgi:hypothetical protein